MRTNHAIRWAGIALLSLGLTAPAFAATTLNSTTLAAALLATGNTVTLTSGTNVSVGDLLFVDREAMKVNSISSAIAQVSRGWSGTASVAHATLSIVYTGAPERFYANEVVGTCSTTTELYLPHITLPTGHISQCSNSVWNSLGADIGTIQVNCKALLVADQLDQLCFIADRDYVITGIKEVAVTPEAGGTLTIIPRKTVDGTVIASGTALATAINVVTGSGRAAMNIQTATLSATASALYIASGSILGLDYTDDTAGELAGVTVTFSLAPR